MPEHRIFPILDRPTLLRDRSEDFVKVPFYITFDFSTLVFKGEERLEELKRPFFKWNQSHENIQIVSISENYGSLGEETYLESVTLKVKPPKTGFKYSHLKELIDRIETINTRNVYFDEGVVLEFLVPKDNQVRRGLEDDLYAWERKWRSGKNPFRIDVRYRDRQMIVDVDPHRRLTVYQLSDLLEDIPEVEVNIW